MLSCKKSTNPTENKTQVGTAITNYQLQVPVNEWSVCIGGVKDQEESVLLNSVTERGLKFSTSKSNRINLYKFAINNFGLGLLVKAGPHKRKPIQGELILYERHRCFLPCTHK